MATKKRRRKSVHQIVKKAVTDIKKTLKEDGTIEYIEYTESFEDGR